MLVSLTIMRETHIATYSAVMSLVVGHVRNCG